MLKTPHSFEYNCFEFFKLSCEYETEDKLFVGTSLVFSHTTCSWSTAKKIRETWSREKICPIHSSWHDYWCQESFGAVTQVIGQVFYTKVIMSRVDDFWLICRWMWHSSNTSFILWFDITRSWEGTTLLTSQWSYTEWMKTVTHTSKRLAYL